MIRGIKKLVGCQDYIFYRVLGKLAADARKYFLSYIWWIIDPLFEMAVYILVFSLFLNRGTPNFPQFLLVGLTTWRLFANSVMAESSSLREEWRTLTIVYLPKTVPPAVVLGTSFIKYLITFCLLIFFLLITGFKPNVHWVVLPWIIVNVVLLSYGVGCMLAAIVPFLPDLQYLINTGLRLGFFMSGLFYDIRTVAPKYADYLMMNPMASLITNMRLILLEGTAPDFSQLYMTTIVSIGFVLLGIKLLETFDHLYPRMLKA